MSYGSILNQSSISNNDSLPIGVICMWSGQTNNIPENWQLCNGTNGTPDLRGQFVIGAGGSYSVGNTGGEATHRLTISEMPSHNHLTEVDNNKIYYYPSNGVYQGYGISSSGSTYNTGGSQPHNNLPPYYALCYIMKIA